MKYSVIERMCVVEKDYDRFIRKDLRERDFSGCFIPNVMWRDDDLYVTLSTANKEDKFDHCTFRFAGNIKIKAHDGKIPEVPWKLKSLKSSYVNDMNAKQRFCFAFIGDNFGFRIQCYAVYICEYVTENKITDKTMKEENYEMRMRVSSFTEAVFNCDWERFQSLLDKGLWDDYLLKGNEYECQDELLFQPLHHITIAQDILLNWFCWDDELFPLLKIKAEKNDKFKKFFAEHYHVPMDYKELLSFEKRAYSYSVPEDPFEDVFDFTREELHEQGFSDNDIDLYWAVYTLNFEWAENLLKKGANPNSPVHGGEDVYYLLNWMEIGPMSEVDPYLKNHTLKYICEVEESCGFFSYMIRYALFAEMHSLVNSYCPKKEK